VPDGHAPRFGGLESGLFLRERRVVLQSGGFGIVGGIVNEIAEFGNFAGGDSQAQEDE